MSDPLTVLVTGGAGYIGSHTCVTLLEAGARVVVIDNLDNSSAVALDRVRELVLTPPIDSSSSKATSGTRPTSTACSRRAASSRWSTSPASRPSASRWQSRCAYYDNNVAGTVQLLEAMERHDVRDLVFSSSCTVYGEPDHRAHHRGHSAHGDESVRPHQAPHRGDAPRRRARPGAGRSRCCATSTRSARTRAAASARIRVGIPNNLMPYIMQVAVGRRDHLTVFGDDYPTPDGTGVRDYLHVVDLAEGHLAALDDIDRFTGARAVNLGTGTGCSVLDVVHTATEVTGRPIPYEIGPRRAGDVVQAWADPTRARELLGWSATRSLSDMCADHWRWQSANPDGYRTG